MTTEEAEKRLNDLIDECQRQAEQEDRQPRDYRGRRDNHELWEQFASRA